MVFDRDRQMQPSALPGVVWIAQGRAQADRLCPQAFKQPPFRLAEEGWGEFDMSIVLSIAGKGGEHTIAHDLNFQSTRYESNHKQVHTACSLADRWPTC